MRYDIEQLQTFWEAAGQSGPLLIVGGGRWGRVWAKVAAAARGSCEEIAVLSRNHYHQVSDWAISTPDLNRLLIVTDMDSALRGIGKPDVTIIASRPIDHVDDATEALDAGSHVLVEKPISNDVAAARRLALHATKRKLRLGIGTEFAFLPALHFLARKLSQADPQKEIEAIGNIRILWSDPTHENRYGSQKRTHSEISLLEDILPHVVSILKVLLPEAAFKIAAAHNNATSGEMVLTDGTGRRFDCVCSKEAEHRLRLVQIDFKGALVTLDFGSEPPVIHDGARAIPLPPSVLALGSTLRLELGAFNMAAKSPEAVSPLIRAVDLMLDLQEQLSNSCRQAKI